MMRAASPARLLLVGYFQGTGTERSTAWSMLSEFSPRRTSRLSRVHMVRLAKFGGGALVTIEA